MTFPLVYEQALAAKAAAREEEYRKVRRLGEGTYAVVFEAEAQQRPEVKVAIKKIKLGQQKEGLDVSAIREVKFLQEMRHPYIIKLHDVYAHKQTLNLVLEYLHGDLEMIVRDKSLVFKEGDVKSWMRMTLLGIEYCHRHWVIHRDLKPNNLLIAADGTLRIADFGLARYFGEPLGNMTSQVVTRWYRAPELLLGARDYGVGVDIWSIGCIFAELMLRVPFIAGESDLDQLSKMYMALGTPTLQEWPEMESLGNYAPPQPVPSPDQRGLFKAASEEALALMRSMFTYNPLKRINSAQALKHPYFVTECPPASHPEDLPRCSS